MCLMAREKGDFLGFGENPWRARVEPVPSAIHLGRIIMKIEIFRQLKLTLCHRTRTISVSGGALIRSSGPAGQPRSPGRSRAGGVTPAGRPGSMRLLVQFHLRESSHHGPRQRMEGPRTEGQAQDPAGIRRVAGEPSDVPLILAGPGMFLDQRNGWG
jgi:hypothetical protein